VFAELLASPGVVEHCTLRSRVGFLALHGGLEEGTAEIVQAAAESAGASAYAVVQPPDFAWHIPSHRLDPAASPRLLAVLDHCETVVSVHGFGRAGYWTSVLVGGADRGRAVELGEHLRVALPEYEILDEITAIPQGLRGLDERNPVNRARGGGVQLELPPRVRGIGPHWKQFDGDGLTPHTQALVQALVAFARARPGC
jgi:phage replication-related protein YjqB (UPF0714/DUF867 family)